MSRGTAYYDLPNGERIELPTTMPDVEEVPGPLCDGKFELPEAVKEMFKWMDETFGTWESDFSSFKIWMKLRKNFNPPVRWEAVQDKRRNPKPLGRNTYLYKARKIKSLARSKKVKTKNPARAPAGESIEKRPAEVKDREEFGHWEMDTVYSGKKKSTVALLVLTERKTRNENIIMVPDRRAETTVQAINALERKLGAEKFGIIYKSITVDNGSEFALADQLEQSCITGDKRTKVYYCHPYSSWERGSNENVNGMIRRRHPKGTDFSKVTAEEIAATENWINSYPRKIFGYKSAGTMFRECLRELGLTA